MRLNRLLLLAPLLTACGLIPLPEQAGNDFHVINELGPLQASQVAYLNSNQLEYLKIPRLSYRDVTLKAAATYRGESKQLRVQLFALNHSPNCPFVEAKQEGYGGAYLCNGTGGGQYLTELLLSPDKPLPIVLKNPILDQAVREGTLYLGARILEGQLDFGERVEFTQIRFRGRL
ncbi:MAG: hypothetical protein JWQ08_2632 [Deinococcus sp.]|nr:hypothetical protein [Deinococcus sp.]